MVEVRVADDRLPDQSGIFKAYVADPDGNVVELMHTGVAVTGDEPEISALPA